MDFSRFTKRGLKNAEFFLNKTVNGKPGESMIIFADEFTYPDANLIAICAKKKGMLPFIVDLSIYGNRLLGTNDFKFNPAIKAAIQASDICVTTCQSFSRLLGSGKEMDNILTGQQRCFAFWTRHMEEWDFDEEEVYMGRKRAIPVRDLVKKSKLLHITTEKGTDITCEVGEENLNAIYEVLAICPFFAEVAIIPKYGTVNGKLVADGAASRQLRNDQFGCRERDVEPVVMTFKDSVMTSLSGDPVQVERIQEWMHSDVIPADHVDEIGIVTCTADINDEYQWFVWNDGSHHSKSFHLAIGNNNDERKDVIHGKLHSDFDVWNPVIELDGHVIYRDGKFDDEYVFTKSGHPWPPKD